MKAVMQGKFVHKQKYSLHGWGVLRKQKGDSWEETDWGEVLLKLAGKEAHKVHYLALFFVF